MLIFGDGLDRRAVSPPPLSCPDRRDRCLSVARRGCPYSGANFDGTQEQASAPATQGWHRGSPNPKADGASRRRHGQDTVLFLSCLEAQKLRFQGEDHSAALRGSFRLASAKVAGPFRVGAGGASTSDVGWSHNGPSPAAEPDAFSELDRGPLGGGAAPITANGATAGILSGPHAHPPEPAVSGTVNRAGPVTDRDTRRNFVLIPLDVS